MKKLISATIAAAALGFAAQASAADLGARPMYTKAPVVAPVYNWTGGYVGINGGGGWADSSFGNNLSGGFVGGTLGYNWQSGQAVFGLETDIAWSGIDGSSTIGLVPVTVSNDYFGTVRGRLGYAWDRTLLFASGGFAYGNISASSPFGSIDTTSTGYAVGGGVEVALNGPWTAKVEYLHIDLGDSNCTACIVGGANVDYSADLVRAGLNYRF